jgi:hypothetical protein
MAKFKKGQHIRNKYNGSVYLITDVLEASYVIECKLINRSLPFIIPFEEEDEWELTENSQEIIKLLNTAKYLLRGHKQNLNISWALEKINEAIKIIKDKNNENRIT